MLNLSKEYSECQVKLCVSMNLPRSELEAVLERELPAIGETESRILFGPYLLGVYTLSVGAMCDQKDEEEVTYCLNRELKLIAEREWISMI